MHLEKAVKDGAALVLRPLTHTGDLDKATDSTLALLWPPRLSLRLSEN